MELEDLIKDLQNSLEFFEKMMEYDTNEKEKYKDNYVYAVTMLGYLEELKELRIVNKNISRELITRTDNLKKANIEAQKYFDLLMDDERVINAMARYLVGFAIIPDNNKDTVILNSESEIIDYFRKECE